MPLTVQRESAPPPTSPPTQAPNFTVVTLSGSRPTLPPTWTPTHTATHTLTPTITLTPSDTPTITPVDETLLCQQFSFRFDGEEGAVYQRGDVIRMDYGMGEPEFFLIFGAVNQANTDDIVLRATESGTFYRLILPAEDFPSNGEYEWSVSVSTWEEGGLCEQTGRFIIDVSPEPVMVQGLFARLKDALAQAD